MTPSEYLAFYTGTGVFASVASNAFNLYARIGNPSVGASGAIFGVLSYFCMSHPDAGILVFFIPMSAFTGLMLGTAVNAGLVIRAASAIRSGRAPPAVDGMAHLAGTIAGIAYYYVKSAREQSRSHGIRI
jgi:rhomboid-like protein